MTLLENLWYGNIAPHESFLDHERHYRKLISILSRNRDELNSTLTDSQKEVLEKYEDISNEMHSLSERSAFQYGFSLGIRLMMESVFMQLNNCEE